MHDFERILQGVGHHLKAVALPNLTKLVLAVLSFVFVHDPQAYWALAGLVAIDTLTGYFAARRRGTANSRTLKLKLVAKVLTYVILLAAYGLFYRVVASGEVELFAELTDALGVLVLASIGAVELKSIGENVRALTGQGLRLLRSAQEVLDYLEANHVLQGDGAGQPQRHPAEAGPDGAQPEGGR
jgi:hypothetical protein